MYPFDPFCFSFLFSFLFLFFYAYCRRTLYVSTWTSAPTKHAGCGLSLPPRSLPPSPSQQPNTPQPLRTALRKISVLADAKSGENYPGKSQETPWQWIEDLLNRMNKDHEPIIDMDHDNFSGTSLLPFFFFFFFVPLLSLLLKFLFILMIMFVDVSTMRGYSWKGRDCNDLDSSVHPGISLPPLPLFPSLSLILTSLHLFCIFSF